MNPKRVALATLIDFSNWCGRNFPHLEQAIELETLSNNQLLDLVRLMREAKDEARRQANNVQAAPWRFTR